MHADRCFYSMSAVGKDDWNRIFKGDQSMPSVKHYQSDRSDKVAVKGHQRGKKAKAGKPNPFAKKGKKAPMSVPMMPSDGDGDE
jgi:hypothetical protein